MRSGTSGPGHPPGEDQPELVASAPGQVCSWDITNLQGPGRGVLPPVRHARHLQPLRRRLAVAAAESSELATEFIDDVTATHGIPQAIHADRGTSMTSKPVAATPRRPGRHPQPLPAPGIQRQPVLRSAVQDAEILPGLPRPLRFDRRRPRVLPAVLHPLQPRPPPQGPRPAHPRIRALRHRDRHPRAPRRRPARRSRPQPRTVQPTANPAAPARSGMDQPTNPTTSDTDRITSPCLTSLFSFRPGSRAHT